MNKKSNNKNTGHKPEFAMFLAFTIFSSLYGCVLTTDVFARGMFIILMIVGTLFSTVFLINIKQSNNREDTSHEEAN